MDSRKLTLLTIATVVQRHGEELRRYVGTVTFNGETLFQLETPGGRVLSFDHDPSHKAGLTQVVYDGQVPMWAIKRAATQPGMFEGAGEERPGQLTLF